MPVENNWFRYGLLILAILLLSVIGFLGYTIYPRFDLPAVSGIGLLILALGAGIASFFTPCSFPLLTALLARSIISDESKGSFHRAIQYAAALSIGASLFLLLVGIGLSLGAGILFEQITFTSLAGRLLRLIVGGTLIFLGVVQLGHLAMPFDKVTSIATPIRRLQIKLRDDHPVIGFVIFGFAYILSGFG